MFFVYLQVKEITNVNVYIETVDRKNIYHDLKCSPAELSVQVSLKNNWANDMLYNYISSQNNKFINDSCYKFTKENVRRIFKLK